MPCPELLHAGIGSSVWSKSCRMICPPWAGPLHRRAIRTGKPPGLAIRREFVTGCWRPQAPQVASEVVDQDQIAGHYREPF